MELVIFYQADKYSAGQLSDSQCENDTFKSF